MIRRAFRVVRDRFRADARTPCMRLLLVKTSSLGDVLHTLPAVNDARRFSPDLTLDWLVEEAFAPIASWHEGVARVVPVALRRWRRRPLASAGEASALVRTLRATPYDRIVDAQGLLKSAVLASLARGPRWGPGADWRREPWAGLFYHHAVPGAHLPHVVERLRHLLATALGYPPPETPPDFSLSPHRLPPPLSAEEARAAGMGGEFLLFLHGTAWPSKVWPEASWVHLAREVTARGVRVGLPWGGEGERLRAERVREAAGAGVVVLPAMGLAGLTRWIRASRGVVGLDSGLAHLASALGKPCVTLFGATNPDYSGVPGEHQRFLRADYPCAPCMKRRCARVEAGDPPCFDTVPPERVLSALEELLGSEHDDMSHG